MEWRSPCITTWVEVQARTRLSYGYFDTSHHWPDPNCALWKAAWLFFAGVSANGSLYLLEHQGCYEGGAFKISLQNLYSLHWPSYHHHAMMCCQKKLWYFSYFVMGYAPSVMVFQELATLRLSFTSVNSGILISRVLITVTPAWVFLNEASSF